MPGADGARRRRGASTALAARGLATRLQGFFQGLAGGFRPVETDLQAPAEEKGGNTAGVLSQGLGHRHVGVGSLRVGSELVAVHHQPGVTWRERRDEGPRRLTVRTCARPEEIEVDARFAGGLAVDPQRRLGSAGQRGEGGQYQQAEQV
jgi:hypothetical protein